MTLITQPTSVLLAPCRARAGYPHCVLSDLSPHCEGEVVVAVVGMLFRAEARQRWKSWLLLGVLVALTTGLVLAGVSAGRRTAAAFPQLVATHGYDAVTYSSKPLPKIARLHEVRSVTALSAPATAVPSCACSQRDQPGGIQSVRRADRKVCPTSSIWWRARMPDPSDPHQILASFNLQELRRPRRDGDAGALLRTLAAGRTRERPHNPAWADARPPCGRNRSVGRASSRATTASRKRTFTPLRPSARALSGKTIAFSIYYVRLVHGVDDIPKFESDAQALGALGSADQVTPATSVASSIHPQAVGWWILAALSALVGLVVVAQALARQSLVESETHGVLRALGLARREMVLVGVARTLTIGIIGVFGGLALSFLLSPLTPVGEARLAESSRGLTFDPLVAAIGVLGALVLLLGIGLLSDLRTTRTESPGTTQGRPTISPRRIARRCGSSPQPLDRSPACRRTRSRA